MRRDRGRVTNGFCIALAVVGLLLWGASTLTHRGDGITYAPETVQCTSSTYPHAIQPNASPSPYGCNMAPRLDLWMPVTTATAATTSTANGASTHTTLASALFIRILADRRALVLVAMSPPRGNNTLTQGAPPLFQVTSSTLRGDVTGHALAVPNAGANARRGTWRQADRLPLAGQRRYIPVIGLHGRLHTRRHPRGPDENGHGRRVVTARIGGRRNRPGLSMPQMERSAVARISRSRSRSGSHQRNHHPRHRRGASGWSASAPDCADLQLQFVWQISMKLQAVQQQLATTQAPPSPTTARYYAAVYARRGLRATRAALKRELTLHMQRLLVQVVLMPVVWMSVCCVLGAAMGIECMETLQKVLMAGEDEDKDGDDGSDTDDSEDSHRQVQDARRHARRMARDNEKDPDRDVAPRPTKKARLEVSTTTHGRDSPRSDEYNHKTSSPKSAPPRSPSSLGQPPSVEHAASVVTTRAQSMVRRRRRVIIWDLDETLVLFASLYSGEFARTHHKEVAMGVALGEQMMTYLLAVLERHFFFSELHHADIDHIARLTEAAAPRERHEDEQEDKDTAVKQTEADDEENEEKETPTASATSLCGMDRGSPSYHRAMAARYARIRAIYERHGEADFLDDSQSQWFAAREALVTSIDAFSAGWIQEARSLLELTTRSRPVPHRRVDADAGTDTDTETEAETEPLRLSSTLSFCSTASSSSSPSLSSFPASPMASLMSGNADDSLTSEFGTTHSKTTSLAMQHDEEAVQRNGDEQEEEEADVNVLVTNTQLAPALCKCLIYNLHSYFPIDQVYSSSTVRKQICFEAILARYGGDDVEFVAIGDGAEEEHVSRALGISFFKVRSLEDLKQLRYELDLEERPCAAAPDAETKTKTTTTGTHSDMPPTTT